MITMMIYNVVPSAAPCEEGGRKRSVLQEGTGSVRFVSVPDFSKRNRFGSLRFGDCFSRLDPVWPALFKCVVARSGSVWSGSASGSASGCEVNRFGSAGSDRFLIPSCYYE